MYNKISYKKEKEKKKKKKRKGKEKEKKKLSEVGIEPTTIGKSLPFALPLSYSDTIEICYVANFHVGEKEKCNKRLN